MQQIYDTSALNLDIYQPNYVQRSRDIACQYDDMLQLSRPQKNATLMHIISGYDRSSYITRTIIFFHIQKTSFPEDMAGKILGLRPANERRRYFVMTSLIGWEQA